MQPVTIRHQRISLRRQAQALKHGFRQPFAVRAGERKDAVEAGRRLGAERLAQ
jgi:hypothetical protein